MLQFEEVAAAEQVWLNEAEERLVSAGDIRLELDQTVLQLQAQKVSLQQRPP